MLAKVVIIGRYKFKQKNDYKKYDSKRIKSKILEKILLFSQRTLYRKI